VVRRFGERFTTTDGEPAPTQSLRTCHRAAPQLLPVFGSVATRIKGPASQRELHPAPVVQPSIGSAQLDDGPPLAPGARVYVLPSAGEEAAVIAAELRQAHVLHGVPWEAMAVVVRSASGSGSGSLDALRRAMLAAGVPTGGARSGLPLAEQPAVAPLLWVLQAALASCSDSTAQALLLSELGGADPMSLRRLRQALRAGVAAAGADSAEPPADSATAGSAAAPGGLLAVALADASLIDGIESRLGAPVHRVARLIAAARHAMQVPDASAETVLWEIWNATGLAQEWQLRSTHGGAAGEAANRDLDAVIELFDAAARFGDRMPGATLELFAQHLRAQQLPADVFASDRPDVPGVRLLTAHAAKGLQWDLVVVAGVQEELWPDLRLRGGVLGAGDLVELAAGRALSGPAARAAAYQQLLDEERRLFYVAVTRARRRLVVTAVADEENQPSRFLDDLTPGGTAASGTASEGSTISDSAATDVVTINVVTGGRGPESGEIPSMLSLPSLVAELRRAVTDPAPRGAAATPLLAPSAARRRAAAALLSHLAAAGVPGADPGQWWGLEPVSDDRPLVAPTEPVPVSPSAVEVFADCGLRWLLERRAGGSTPPGLRQQIGLVVHELAAQARAGASATEMRTELRAALRAKLESVDLGQGWTARRERERAQQMVDKLAAWFAGSPRRFVAAEQPFEIEVGRALLRGRVDRLELDEHGRPYVVDFKTGNSAPTGDKIAEHPQLGVYQLAVARGGFGGDAAVSGGTVSDGAVPGGAALVQLGISKNQKVTQQQQPALGESANPEWPVDLVTTVADGMAGSEFVATKGSACPRCPIRPSCPLHSNQTTEPPLPVDDSGGHE
ncbi:MAG: PD-(D/E)XK nuclease family protein, partial [Mycobacteriales bacterium]